MSAVKINLVYIIISVFAGYHLQTIYEINNSIYWKYSLACLIIRTDSPAIINSNYLTPILVFGRYVIHGLKFLYQEADSSHKATRSAQAFVKRFAEPQGFLEPNSKTAL